MKTNDYLGLARTFIEWLFAIEHWNTLEGWIARILVWIVVVYGLLFTLRHILELVAKIAEHWRSLGFRVRRDPALMTHIRRKQQFAKVLIADLAVLAKAENWNDQFFTDLEAEVEAEGSYYANPIDRLFRRKSQGLRRVSSLIRAIETSTEQSLIVTGEPGSGKSIAMRHLANQFAERAHESQSSDEKVPLYINLKELPLAPPSGVTADFIREFVIQNVRRGDADTAAFVKENWNTYRERGIWFFLFDSFDEIPAVLHAPTGSSTIREHADAIRQFLEGMSSCRGVVASREYKGPDVLPWKKLRILPLTLARQEELINNSFLEPEQKATALQHVIVSRQGFLENPLFLTLLCRYVKELGTAPQNDNELLIRHIRRLANREEEYVRDRYGLSSDELLEGSTKIAIAFAENPSLSLAPTQEEIRKVLGVSEPALSSLLGALIEVKIGRCDVKEARTGDQRFTFAHRRYQETLFVQHLATNGYKDPRDLLTDIRWREYIVTLLQTGDEASIRPLIDEAACLLQEFLRARKFIPVEPGFGTQLYYFDWAPNDTQLLQMLQEGLIRRIDVVPIGLRNVVRDYLKEPWERGDSYDRLMVLTYGSLLPEDTLYEYIHWAIEFGTSKHWDAAFKNAFLVNNISEELSKWFRRHLSNRLIAAQNNSEVLRLEAIAARIPREVGAHWVVSRGKKLRESTRLYKHFEKLATSKMGFGFSRLYSMFSDAYSGLPVFSIVLLISIKISLFGYPALFFFLIAVQRETMDFLSILCVLLGLLFTTALVRSTARILILILTRFIGGPATAGMIVKRAAHVFQILGSGFILFIFWVALADGLLYLTLQIIGYSQVSAFVYAIFPHLVLAFFTVTSGWMSARRERLSKRKFKYLRSKHTDSKSVILFATSWEELLLWLRLSNGAIVSSIPAARSLLSHLQDKFDTVRATDTLPLEGIEQKPSRGEYRSAAHLILKRLQELKFVSID